MFLINVISAWIRLSVRCQALGTDSTNFNGGFTVTKRIKEHKEGKTIPSTPAPLCCGSETLRNNSILTKTGLFERISSGGSVTVKAQMPGNDTIPPSRINDIRGELDQIEKIMTLRM